MEQLTSSLEKEIEKLKEMNPEKDSHDETGKCIKLVHFLYIVIYL